MNYTQLTMKLKFKDEKLIEQQSQSKESDNDEKRQENLI